MITPVPDSPEPDRPREPRRSPGEDREHEDVRCDVQQPQHVDDALVVVGAAELARREEALHAQAGDVEPRRNARPPEEPGGDEPGRRQNDYRCQPPDASRRHLGHSR